MKYTLIFVLSITAILCFQSCGIDTVPDPMNEAEPILLDDRYDDDITLTNHNENGIDYIVKDGIEVFDGTMLIEPGTTIQFEEGTYLNIGIDGKLDAAGTASEPIRMIAESNTPSWAGIYINTNLSNKLHHVQIENAGEGKSFGVFNDFEAAVTLDGKVSIENTTISKSGDRGLIINSQDNSDISSFSGNTIRDCEQFPIQTHFNYITSLDLTSNQFSNNGKNMIAIVDFYNERMTLPTVMDGLDIPYYFDGKFQIYEDLTINKGAELIMAQNSLIEHEASGDFQFEIAGTEDEHVVIRGEESESEYWQGIFIGSENSKNEFNYLDISDGGSTKLTFRDGKANISMEFSAKLTINECTSARSGECEVFISQFGGNNVEFNNNSPAITKVCTE